VYANAQWQQPIDTSSETPAADTFNKWHLGNDGSSSMMYLLGSTLAALFPTLAVASRLQFSLA